MVPELTAVYLLKVTGSFIGISEKGIPWELDIRNSTAGAPQPGHEARINPFRHFTSIARIRNTAN